jgi:hypothetical protein
MCDIGVPPSFDILQISVVVIRLIKIVIDYREDVKNFFVYPWRIGVLYTRHVSWLRINSYSIFKQASWDVRRNSFNALIVRYGAFTDEYEAFLSKFQVEFGLP